MRRLLPVASVLTLLAVPQTSSALGTAGGLDPTFNGGQPLVVRPDPAVAKRLDLTDVVSDAQGRLVATGSTTTPDGGGGALAVTRVLPTGALDTGFAGGGTFVRQLSSGGPAQQFSIGHGISLGVGGRVLVGLARYQGGVAHHAAFALTDAGNAEVEYGTGGLATTTNATPKSLNAQGGAFGPDGSSYALGSFFSSTPDPLSGSYAITKFTPGGTPDPAFSAGGTVIRDASTNPMKPSSTAYSALVQPDGMLLVGGATSTGTDFAGFVTRMESKTGFLDPNFGTAGSVTRLDPRAPGTGAKTGFGIADLALAGDAIYAVGGTYDVTGTPAVMLARLRSDGTLDTTYADGGFKTLQVGGPQSGATGKAVVVQPDGKVVVAAASNDGTKATEGVVLRLLPDGTLDRGFGQDGLLRLAPAPGVFNVVDDIALSGDRLAVVGHSGDTTSFVARVLLQPLPDSGASAVPAGAGETAPAASRRGSATVAGRRLRLDRRGRVVLRVSCPASAGPCAGGVGLVAASGKLPARAAAKRRAARYGRKAYSLAAGRRATVRIAVARSARRTIARKGRLKARLVIRRTGGRQTTADVVLLKRRG